MGNRVYHPVFRAVRFIGKQGKLVGIGIVVSVFFQQDIQPVVPPLDKVAGGKTPLRKHDGAAVGLLHGQSITAQDVFLQDIPHRFPALLVGCRFYSGGIFLIPKRKKPFPAFLCVVCQNIHAVNTGHRQHRVTFVIAWAFAVATFYHCQLAAQHLRQKVTVAAGGFYVPADFDTKEKPSPGSKPPKKA